MICRIRLRLLTPDVKKTKTYNNQKKHHQKDTRPRYLYDRSFSEIFAQSNTILAQICIRTLKEASLLVDG
jgi:hypothetical protein